VAFAKWVKSPFALFLYKKLLMLLITFLVAATLLFVIPRLMPASPVDMMVARLKNPYGSGGLASPIPVEVLRKIYIEKFGLDKSIEIQFLDFWKRIFTMDFGVSFFRYPMKVVDLVVSALPWTLVLVVPAPIIGFIIGNWIGSRAAMNSKSKLNNILYYFALYGSVLPYYWFALILVYVFAADLKWFPVYGAYSDKWLGPTLSLEWAFDAIYHWILPFVSLMGVGIGGWATGMRASIESQSQSTYIEYSKKIGFSPEKLRKYMQRNAILPNFTWLPMTFAYLIGQTLLVEIVFGYPGIGTLMYNAAYSSDYPMLEATFVVLMITVLVGNFICDIIYGILDPAIGARYVSNAE
jgi:peptide/nickel transport system permease protein